MSSYIWKIGEKFWRYLICTRTSVAIANRYKVVFIFKMLKLLLSNQCYDKNSIEFCIIRK